MITFLPWLAGRFAIVLEQRFHDGVMQPLLAQAVRGGGRMRMQMDFE
jgi:hypothetical protein